MFNGVEIVPTGESFFSASGQTIKPMGKIRIKVERASNDEIFALELIIIQSERSVTPLLGRNWLDILFPKWRQAFELKNVETDELAEIKRKFPGTINASNESIKGFEANLVLKEDYCPIFHKAYLVPFTLQKKVEEELDKMVEEGVLVPTKYSEWASPVVVVKKENGSENGLDGKATLNKYLSMEHYPLPKTVVILAKISNWKIFSKIDLSGAYLLKLSESAQKICTINTLKGLYNYTRMPFGIHTAPAIFQSVIDQNLRYTKGLAYIDDIIVGGENMEECKNNLIEVMGKLNSHNVKINANNSVFYGFVFVYVNSICLFWPL